MPKKVSRNRETGRVYLGVDPGNSGGFACVSDGGTLLDYIPMLSELDTWQWISRKKGINIAYIEKVHAMPKQGVKSMFTFGQSHGRLRMALIAAGIPFKEVLPTEWQRAMGVSKRGKQETKPHHKERLRAKCQELFPRDGLWRMKLGDQRAVCDAILIAMYARQCEK